MLDPDRPAFPGVKKLFDAILLLGAVRYPCLTTWAVFPNRLGRALFIRAIMRRVNNMRAWVLFWVARMFA